MKGLSEILTSGVLLLVRFVGLEEKKKRRRRTKETERSKKKEFGDMSFTDLSLFQAFAMEVGLPPLTCCPP